MSNKKELTSEEWIKLRTILYSMFDLTWEYAELRAKKISGNLDEIKPNRDENESFKNYNERMLNWNQSKTDAYTKTFNDVKSKSFDLITELEEILSKLGMPGKK